ncbi:MAG TPA: hypothetical protein VEI49_04060 [Terriglobales bacterium]|nr:hypothetical protein [Terriglobales bacterium]
MSSSAPATAMASVNTRKCPFCAEEILSEAKKCKHCGEFVNGKVSKRVLAIFSAGVVIACVLAGMQTASSEGVLAVGVWAIFALLLAEMFVRG